MKSTYENYFASEPLPPSQYEILQERSIVAGSRRLLIALWDAHPRHMAARGCIRPKVEATKTRSAPPRKPVIEGRPAPRIRVVHQRKPGPLGQSIIDMAAAAFKIEPEQITGLARTNYIVSARFVVCKILREQTWADGSTRFSYPHIGSFLGGRDHSTIIHAVETFDDRARKYPEMWLGYESVKAGLAATDES